jgi:dUTP pyrophosphatase
MPIHTAQSGMVSCRYLQVKRLNDSATLPTRGNDGDAGWDLYSNESVTIPSGATVLVSTGIAMAIPRGYAGLIWDRSSMGVKGVHRHAGVIDSGYRGPVKVCLHNTTKEPYSIEHGDRVAQILIQEIPFFRIQEVEELDPTKRGSGGFGSTGK